MNLDSVDKVIITQIAALNYNDVPASITKITQYLSERFPGVEFIVDVLKSKGVIDIKISTRTHKNDKTINELNKEFSKPITKESDTRSIKEKAAELEVTVDYYMMEFQ